MSLRAEGHNHSKTNHNRIRSDADAGAKATSIYSCMLIDDTRWRCAEEILPMCHLTVDSSTAMAG